VKTLKVSFVIGRHVKRDGFACRDEGQRAKPDSPLWGFGMAADFVSALIVSFSVGYAVKWRVGKSGGG